MTKRFNVVVRYRNGAISQPQIVDSVEAIIKNLRIMNEGDTFQITRLKFIPGKRQQRKLAGGK